MNKTYGLKIYNHLFTPLFQKQFKGVEFSNRAPLGISPLTSFFPLICRAFTKHIFSGSFNFFFRQRK